MESNNSKKPSRTTVNPAKPGVTSRRSSQTTNPPQSKTASGRSSQTTTKSVKPGATSQRSSRTTSQPGSEDPTAVPSKLVPTVNPSEPAKRRSSRTTNLPKPEDLLTGVHGKLLGRKGKWENVAKDWNYLKCKTIVNGEVKDSQDGPVRWKRTETNGIAFFLLKSKSSSNNSSVTKADPKIPCVTDEELDIIVQSLVYFDVGTDYKDVVKRKDYQKLYNLQKKPLDYDLKLKPSPQWSQPCRICGLWLPAGRNISIDHQRPQSGGWIYAIAKVFRVFGLTEKQPNGHKGQTIFKQFKLDLEEANKAKINQAKTAKTKPNIADIKNLKDLSKYESKPVIGRLGNRQVGDVEGRYTLNEKGTIVFTILGMLDHWEDMCKFSMNSFINLRPLCFCCNGSKSNHKPGQWIKRNEMFPKAGGAQPPSPSDLETPSEGGRAPPPSPFQDSTDNTGPANGKDPIDDENPKNDQDPSNFVTPKKDTAGKPGKPPDNPFNRKGKLLF